MRRILVIVTFIFIVLSVTAQEFPVSFQRYYSKDGLSSNTIYAIHRDTYGFLWLGTEDGLTRFDGSSYKAYRYDANAEHGLQTNHITSLCEDSKGRIWIGTNGGGLSYYDRNLDQIYTYTRTPENKPMSTAITALTTDKNGNVWVCSYGAVFVINVQDLGEPCSREYDEIQKIFSGKVSRYVYKDQQGGMWVSAEGSVYHFNEDLRKVKRYELLTQPSIKGTTIEITSIVEDMSGRIWVGSIDGLSYLDKNALSFTKF